MIELPDELVFHIFNYLEAQDIVHIQAVSHKFLRLARDSTLWKTICFDDSQEEANRRRQRLYALQDARLADLREAIAGFPPHLTPTVDIDGIQQDLYRLRNAARDPESLERTRALANWDPAYPRETIDYYEEYIHRHAKINLDWRSLPNVGTNDKDDIREAMSLSLLYETDLPTQTVSSLDDGSVVIYDLSTNHLAGHSGPGLLTPGVRTQSARHSMMTDASSVEVLSIDSRQSRGFFAVGSLLHEIDLRQLSLVSTKQYSFPITALSSCGIQPLVVGTNNTVHIYDERDPVKAMQAPTDARTELIAGPALPNTSHVALTQPGPLSILHAPTQTQSVFVAGRFTSLLQYSLRFFPRLEGTTHSGARISCMTSLDGPYMPQQYDLVKHPDVTVPQYAARKAGLGWTAICAGEYKGKGSLELYSMSSTTSSHDNYSYLNRQTAGRSKLLSVACHGGKIVHTDGDGNIRWSERNGINAVRSYNINDERIGDSSDERSPDGLWANSREEHGDADIVQKVLPIRSLVSMSGHQNEKLLLWTGDGRLGTLSFGPQDMSSEQFHDAVEVQAETAAEHARQDAERQYAMTMRRALERNANEVRFVRGLGMAE